jgi:hypothetical protein
VTTVGYPDQMLRSSCQVASWTSSPSAVTALHRAYRASAPTPSLPRRREPRKQRGGRVMRRAVATLVTLCGLVACFNQSTNVDAVEVDGRGTLGLSVPRQPVKGVVVYFHGMDQKPNVIKDSPKHRALLDPLLRSGYAVVSADAGGSAFGNPVSQQQYRRLIAAARSKYHAEPKLFVAESMGALAALALLTEDISRHVKGMVGITPLMGLPPAIRSVNYIANAWVGGVPSSADPMSWSPELFAGRALRLYEAAEDDVIPPGATAQDFADRFGSAARIEVIRCGGGHVADDCYEGNDVMNWMARLG